MLFIFFLLPAGVIGGNSVEEAFKKSFPRQNFESISPTPIAGIYEVYAGNQTFYFSPEAEVIITGNIISKDGVNLTRQRHLQKMAPRMADLPLKSALKIGRGKTKVLEFTDPNCPYCRQAFQYFAKRKDVTLYVFLIPLSQDSEKKIRHIFCAKDKIKAYEDVMTGKMDSSAPFDACTDKKVEDTIKTHHNLTSQAGVRAAPTFYIKGEVAEGFEKNNIENILNK
ncbi:MAG TPA: DsbC family protein [Deltaproteobacteria bacterium]|nr:DsbC family protein [Deltaproteobacteria bacterium]